jgi:hypothetical protein
MKKFAAILFFLAVSLWAVDFWRSKPFTEWSEKEVQRMLQDSPWSHTVNLASTASQFPSVGRQRPNSTPDDIPGPPPNIGGGIDDPIGRSASNGRGTTVDPMDGGAAEKVVVIVRWHSSLAIKQALVRFKYGSEAGTSPEAKKMAEAVDPNYIVVVTGIPKMLLRGDSDAVRKFLIQQTSISVKGREAMKPVDVMLHSENAIDAYFAFRRNPPITVEDKDVDFATNLGGSMLRQRFHLKDMLLNGKLDL